MDRFLRELDKAIGSLTPDERARALGSLKELMRAAPGIAFVKGISKMAWVQLLGSVVLALSSEQPMEKWVEKTKAKALTIGEHVGTLFQAL